MGAVEPDYVPWSFAAGLAGAAGPGLPEPPAPFAALGAERLTNALPALGLGFAAGAMLSVIVDELIPESHTRGFEREASHALLAGFAPMPVPDTALG